jgi:hypothetical protein
VRAVAAAEGRLPGTFIVRALDTSKPERAGVPAATPFFRAARACPLGPAAPDCLLECRTREASARGSDGPTASWQAVEVTGKRSGPREQCRRRRVPILAETAVLSTLEDPDDDRRTFLEEQSGSSGVPAAGSACSAAIHRQALAFDTHNVLRDEAPQPQAPPFGESVPGDPDSGADDQRLCVSGTTGGAPLVEKNDEPDSTAACRNGATACSGST